MSITITNIISNYIVLMQSHFSGLLSVRDRSEFMTRGWSFSKGNSLAYTSKGCTPIEVLPVPNAYTISQLTTGVSIWQNEYIHHQIWYTHWGQEVPQ